MLAHAGGGAVVYPFRSVMISDARPDLEKVNGEHGTGEVIGEHRKDIVDAGCRGGADALEPVLVCGLPRVPG